MEGEKNKKLVADPQFDALISKPRGITETIKRNARLEDTIAFLPKVMHRVAWQTEKIAPFVAGRNLEETCGNIWDRLYRSIQYQKDDVGKEQIRSPRCTWWNKRADCDDFSVFVSSILCNLGIPHLFRIAMYDENNGYQHIYVVVPSPSGKEIIIDCVLNKFNREVPFIQKIDKKMDLQFLDGVDDEFMSGAAENIDAEDLLKGEMGDLGRRRLRDVFKNLGNKLKDGLHKLNRFNPATALLRGGVLASMNLNVFNIAGTLRYTYLSDDQAKQKHFNMAKFPKLRSIREKLEKIFYGAGGKIENLKKAILEGKGNTNHEVPLSGFGEIDLSYSEQSELPQLLSEPLYKDELMGAEDMETLGFEPTTDAALAAATAAMAAIAGLIKKLGPLKTGDNTDSSSGGGSTDSGSTVTSTDTPITDPAPSPGASADSRVPSAGDPNKPSTTNVLAADDGTDNTLPDTTSNRISDETANLSFIQRSKKWIVENPKAATAIGVVSAAAVTAIIIGTVKYIRKNKKQETSIEPATLSGVKRRHKKKIKIQRLR